MIKIKSTELTPSLWKDKKDFNVMIECITTVATLKKINVRTLSSDGIMSFAKKYAQEINDEYKRIDTMKKANQPKKEEKKKFW